MAERILLWTVTDPRGLLVSLSVDSWQHIISEHAYMAPFQEAVKQTVADPNEIYFDPLSTQSRKTGAQVYAYYKSQVLTGLFQDNWAYVSVKFVPEQAGVQGYVQTALSTNDAQKRMVLVWTK